MRSFFKTIQSMLDFGIKSLIAALLLFSPLIYGGIAPLPLFLIELAAFALIFIVFLKEFLKDEVHLIRIPIIWLAAFIVYIIFQLIPFSNGMLSIISPATASLYDGFKINLTSPSSISIYPDATIAYLLQFLCYVAVFYAVLASIKTMPQLKRMVAVLVACGSIYALYGIVKGVGLDRISFSTFTNRDHFAAYLEMIIPLGIGYALSESHKLRRLIVTFFVSVMVVVLFFTFSRAGVISLIISMLFFLFLLKLKRPTKKWITVVIILCIFLGILFGLVELISVSERLRTLLDPMEAYKDRLHLVTDSLKIIRDFQIGRAHV